MMQGESLKQNQPIDYSHEVKLIRSKPMRYLLIALSCFFLALGILGVLLPGLPTTPFVLLSAYLYAKSSARFYNWLMNQKHMGPPLRNWKETGSIPLKVKVFAILVLTATLGPTIIFLVPILAIKVGLAIIGILVAIFIATRPNS